MTKELRREFKRRARKSVFSHYFMLLFICIVAAVFGSEQVVVNPLSRMESITKTESQSNNVIHSYSWTDVAGALIEDRMEETEENVDNSIDQYVENSDNVGSFGRSRGVLASVVNNLSSGKLYVMVALALHSVTKSKIASSILIILGALLIYLLIEVLVKNVFGVILRRMLYETSTYEKVPLNHALSILGSGNWVNVALGITLKQLYLFFWGFTIIGYFIKTEAYFMVDFILAENPSIKPREAIKLSRRMMYGHKWESFKYTLSYIGWILLGAATIGISDIFYGIPYRYMGLAEYAKYIRQCAFENHVEGVEVLNDDLLFNKAPQSALNAAYADTLEQKQWIEENKIELKGIQKFFVDYLGVWIGSTKDKNQYQKVENKAYSLTYNQMIVEGLAYPYRLNSMFEAHKSSDSISFLRAYSIWSLLAMFLTFSFVGWLWEVIITLISSGHFANRGMLHGPWLPIYGEGLILIILVGAYFRKKPVVEFIVATTLCGILEYYTAYYMWTHYHKMWWDYHGYFLNLHGRICAEGLLVFGIGGMLIVYLVAPVLDTIVSRINTKILIPILVVLAVLFTGDYIYSQIHPNEGKGVTDTGAVVEVIDYS